MLDTFFGEIFVPVLDKLFAQVIRFVDQQDELLVAVTLFLTDLTDIFFEVSRVEKVWVS